MPPAVLKLLVIDGGKDGLRINDLFPGLLADDQGIRHQVVDHAGVALRIPVDGVQGGFAQNGNAAARHLYLVGDIFGHFLIGEPLEIIMDNDPLAEGFIDGLCKGAVEIGFPAEDEGKTV